VNNEEDQETREYRARVTADALKSTAENSKRAGRKRTIEGLIAINRQSKKESGENHDTETPADLTH